MPHRVRRRASREETDQPTTAMPSTCRSLVLSPEVTLDLLLAAESRGVEAIAEGSFAYLSLLEIVAE